MLQRLRALRPGQHVRVTDAHVRVTGAQGQVWKGVVLEVADALEPYDVDVRVAYGEVKWAAGTLQVRMLSIPTQSPALLPPLSRLLAPSHTFSHLAGARLRWTRRHVPLSACLSARASQRVRRWRASDRRPHVARERCPPARGRVRRAQTIDSCMDN